ncbi:MAG: SNF2-related protein [Actinomycetota bacterium]
MARRSRHRPPHLAQATWRSDSVHIWGWNGLDTASMAWMYGGFRAVAADGTRSGWHDSPISYGELGRVAIDVDGVPSTTAASVRLEPLGLAVWLSELPGAELVTPSVEWFAALAELARRTVSTGRITPVVVEEGPFTVARWVPIVDDHVRPVLDALDSSMPPICRAGSIADTSHMFGVLVDGIARATLSSGGWKADLGRGRAPSTQGLRAVSGALAGADPVVRSGSDAFDVALGQLRDDLDRRRRRLDGEPVVVPRVRLLIHDDPNDPWEVRIEVVDDDDPLRWCTADDVWSRAPAATELARGAERLDPLADAITSAAVAMAAVVPGLADLALEHEPSSVEFELPEAPVLDVDLAEEFLTVAPRELERLGIDLLGPEHLVRTSTRVTGEVTPTPADDRTGSFGQEALVAWRMVVDGEEISDAELERVAAAGSTLLHTGHRWVRIDADEIQRKRARLQELRTDASSVGPIELLRLANASDDGDTLDISVVGSAVDVDVDVDEAGDGLGTGAGGEVAGGIGASIDDWVGAVLAGLPDERLDEAVESGGFVGELRHYQRRGLAWMRFLSRLGLGGCLADDMGLGKTATTLAHLLERPGPHLVVCPLSVVRNWRTEAERFTPWFEVLVHHGSGREERLGALVSAAPADRESGDEEPGALFSVDPERQLVVTTYGLLPRDVERLSSVAWSTVVLDEAQAVKNPNTKAARAVRRLPAAQKLALTGTPVENRLSELWAILDAVNPGMLGSLERFRNTFSSPIERNGDAEVAARLRRLTSPFVLRRTKADKRLLPDLPDKIEQIAYARLTREQATLYQQVVDQLLDDADTTEGMQRRGLVLSAIMRLKQICNHPAHALKDGSRLAGRSGKLERFDELITDLLDRDERALVFTQFREMGDLIVRHVDEQFRVRAPFLHGGTSRQRRDAMIDGFQDLTAPPILVVSLQAGGTGLNLTAASQVIHYDRWWNPAVEDQATDRAWRIGQTRTVNVHKLVCEGTVEEKIAAVIEDKKALAQQVVGGGEGEGWISELSTDELRRLVTLEADS